jgi:aminoglycoside 6'-N-acetyltransferase
MFGSDVRSRVLMANERPDVEREKQCESRCRRRRRVRPYARLQEKPASMTAMRGRLTNLRPAADGDAEMLVAWHDDPDVSRYWDDERFTLDEMRERLARAEVESWIVEAEGEPVGYLQVHETGLDMFLVPPARGRGLGPDAARTMVHHLLHERGWTRVTVDPYTWNEQALRAWRNAGFVPVSHHEPDEEHTAPWVLMEWRA